MDPIRGPCKPLSCPRRLRRSGGRGCVLAAVQPPSGQQRGPPAAWEAGPRPSARCGTTRSTPPPVISAGGTRAPTALSSSVCPRGPGVGRGPGPGGPRRDRGRRIKLRRKGQTSDPTRRPSRGAPASPTAVPPSFGSGRNEVRSGAAGGRKDGPSCGREGPVPPAVTLGPPPWGPARGRKSDAGVSRAGGSCRRPSLHFDFEQVACLCRALGRAAGMPTSPASQIQTRTGSSEGKGRGGEARAAAQGGRAGRTGRGTDPSGPCAAEKPAPLQWCGRGPGEGGPRVLPPRAARMSPACGASFRAIGSPAWLPETLRPGACGELGAAPRGAWLTEA